MKKYEYKHVRYAPGFWIWISTKRFDEDYTALLNKYGNEGWELKSSFHEGFSSHLHLAFAKEQETQAKVAK